MSRLQLTRTDFQKSKNTSAHRTAGYDISELVLRRDQPWEMSLTFNRALQTGDALTIICETGPSASVQKNTRAEMTVSTSGSTTSWSAVRGQSSGAVLPVTINSPANACVGKYKMILQIISGGRTTTSNMGNFFMLYNAWSPNDQVYMSNDAERYEYCLNETGQYWAGTVNNFGSRRWDYGHLESGILECAIALLDRNPNYRKDPVADVSSRNDCIYVGRVMAAMVNSNDDQGVIVGNWSGKYSGGVSPSTWNGSVPILRQWMKSGPVKYGQCWVYAGVLTTVLKALGIPARHITNFESAHDTDGNLNVDIYYDKNGRRIEDLTLDSIWNFHAWCEMMTTRKDLGSAYDGWQIVDATPQEPSKGVYRLGPTSQKAVKEGDVRMEYDTIFVFGEVNADKVYWVDNDGVKTLTHTETGQVGLLTCTKAVGAFELKSITDEYKYPEGSPKEREVFQKAKNQLRTFSLMSRTVAAEAAAPPVEPQFSGRFETNDKTQVGEDLIIILKLKSLLSEPQKIEANMSVTAIIYDNTPVKEILTESQTVTLEPNGDKDIKLTVSYPSYKGAITPDNMIKVVAVCKDERGGSLLVNIVVVLENPPLLIRLMGQAALNQSSSADIIFTNPIEGHVDNSVAIFEGSGLFPNPLVVNVDRLLKNQRVTIEIDIEPYRCGERCLCVDFSSPQFPNLKAFLSVMVASP